jgi:hypothetical protein
MLACIVILLHSFINHYGKHLIEFNFIETS